MSNETIIFEKIDELKVASCKKSLIIRQGNDEIIIPWQFLNEFMTALLDHNLERG